MPSGVRMVAEPILVLTSAVIAFGFLEAAIVATLRAITLPAGDSCNGRLVPVSTVSRACTRMPAMGIPPALAATTTPRTV